VLEGGEKGIQLSEVSVKAGFLLLDGFNDVGETALKVERRHHTRQLPYILDIDGLLSRRTRRFIECGLYRWMS
jgi:hypothetical protein